MKLLKGSSLVKKKSRLISTTNESFTLMKANLKITPLLRPINSPVKNMVRGFASVIAITLSGIFITLIAQKIFGYTDFLPDTYIIPIKDTVFYLKNDKERPEKLKINQQSKRTGKGIVRTYQGSSSAKIEFRKDNDLINLIASIGPNKNTTDYHFPCPVIQNGSMTIGWSIRKSIDNGCQKITAYIKNGRKYHNKSNSHNPKNPGELSVETEFPLVKLNISPEINYNSFSDSPMILFTINYKENNLDSSRDDSSQIDLDVLLGAVNITVEPTKDDQKLSGLWNSWSLEYFKSIIIDKHLYSQSIIPSLPTTKTITSNKRYTYKIGKKDSISESPKDVLKYKSVSSFLDKENWSPDASKVVSEFSNSLNKSSSNDANRSSPPVFEAPQIPRKKYSYIPLNNYPCVSSPNVSQFGNFTIISSGQFFKPRVKFDFSRYQENSSTLSCNIYEQQKEPSRKLLVKLGMQDNNNSRSQTAVRFYLDGILVSEEYLYPGYLVSKLFDIVNTQKLLIEARKEREHDSSNLYIISADILKEVANKPPINSKKILSGVPFPALPSLNLEPPKFNAPENSQRSYGSENTIDSTKNDRDTITSRNMFNIDNSRFSCTASNIFQNFFETGSVEIIQINNKRLSQLFKLSGENGSLMCRPLFGYPPNYLHLEYGIDKTGPSIRVSFFTFLSDNEWYPLGHKEIGYEKIVYSHDIDLIFANRPFSIQTHCYSKLCPDVRFFKIEGRY